MVKVISCYCQSRPKAWYKIFVKHLEETKSPCQQSPPKVSSFPGNSWWPWSFLKLARHLTVPCFTLVTSLLGIYIPPGVPQGSRCGASSGPQHTPSGIPSPFSELLPQLHKFLPTLVFPARPTTSSLTLLFCNLPSSQTLPLPQLPEGI